MARPKALRRLILGTNEDLGTRGPSPRVRQPSSAPIGTLGRAVAQPFLLMENSGIEVAPSGHGSPLKRKEKEK